MKSKQKQSNKTKRQLWILSSVILGVLLSIVFMGSQTADAAWWNWDYRYRKQLTVINDSGDSLAATTTYNMTLDTKDLYDDGVLQADCDDLRIVYQSGESVYMLDRYVDIPADATDCSDSTATQVYFPLQAAIASSSESQDYYLYYDNSSATTPASSDNAFDIGSKDSLLACPLAGDTTCAAAETPATATGAIRYAGEKGALEFNEAGTAYMTLGSPATLEMLGDGPVTYEFWVYDKGAASNTNHYLLGNGSGGSPTGAFIFYNASTRVITFRMYTDTTDAEAVSTTTFSANTWTHLAFTYDGSGTRTPRIFIGGTEVTYTTQDSGSNDFSDDTAGSYTIPGSTTAAQRYLPGYLDEIRISSIIRYDSAFTPSTAPFVRDEHTRLLLHLDESGDDPRNSGKAIDDSGNANHGTITAATYVRGLVGVDYSASAEGKKNLQAYAGHNGVFVEEGITNKITNPSFDHGTYNTNWDAVGSDLTVSENTTLPYYRYGSKSAKVVNSASGASDITNLEQQINIIDQEYSTTGTTQPGDNSLGLIYWDGAQYNGETVYFEAVIKCDTCSGGNNETDITLTNDTGTGVTGGTISKSGSDSLYALVRSGDITSNLTNGEEYTVQLTRDATAGTAYVLAARLIIDQSASPITDTQTQIEMGDVDSTTATSGTSLTDPKYYQYDDDQHSGTVNAYLEATLQGDEDVAPTSSGPRDAGTGGTDTTVGSTTWIGTTNIYTNNGSDANATGSGAYTTYYLTATNFGFSIPAGATITGITAEIDKAFTSDGNDTGADNSIKIIKGGTVTGTEQSVGAAWPGTDAYSTYGSSSYLWGTTWTYTDINAANFGVAISGVSTKNGGPDTNDFYVDHVRITVNYTATTTFTAYAELYNRTNTAVVGNSTVSVAGTTWGRVRSASALSTNWDTTSDDEYEVRIYSSNSSGTASIANAKIILDQGDAGGLIAVEVVHHYINTAATDADSGYTSQDYRNQYTPANFDAGTYYFESTIKTSAGTGYAQLYNVSDTAAISSSEVTTTAGYERKRSSNISSNMPSATKTLDTQLKNSATNTTTAASSWLLIQAAGVAADDFTIGIGPGNTNTHTLSAYMYRDTTGSEAGTISDTVARLVWEGSSKASADGATYTNIGAGWWRVEYTASTTNSTNEYGIEVLNNETVFVDGVQLEEIGYTTSYADGTMGTGYSWSGTAHNSTSSRTLADLQYAASGNISGSAGAISFWVNFDYYPEVATTYELVHSGVYTGNNAVSFNLNTGSGTNTFTLDYKTNGTGNTGQVTTSSVDLTGWHHIVGSWATDDLRLYIDNSSIGQDTSVTTNATLSSNIILEEIYGKTISDLRIYDTGLTAAEVGDLYYAGMASHEKSYPLERHADGGKGDPAVLHWLLNEGYGTTVNDSGNMNNPGTISGASWNSSATNTGVVLQFDGSNDYIYRTYDDDEELDVNKNSFAVAGWFRAPDTISTQMTLVSRYDQAGYKIYLNTSGNLCFGIDGDATWTPADSACSTTDVADSQWHHFEAVKNGTTDITLYIDADQVAQDATLSANGQLSGAHPTLYVGIDSDGTSNPFGGYMTDVYIYMYSRSEEQINADHNAGPWNRGLAVVFGDADQYIEDGLAGYWKLDESSGNATDSSGNGITLTNNNSTTFVAAKFNNGSEHVPGSSQYFSSATTINNVKTVSFWINPDIGTNYILELNGTTSISTSGGTLSATGFTDPTIYVDGAVTGTLENNILQHVTVTTETPITSSTFNLGKVGANYFDGTLDEVRLYNKKLGTIEVRGLYNWSPGPVAHWKLDEKVSGTSQTLYDSSGNELNGTSNWGGGASGMDCTVRGKYGGGCDFDGTDDDIEISDHALLKPTVGLTLEAWFYSTDTTATQTIVSKTETSGYHLSINENNFCTNNTLCFMIEIGGSYYYAEYASAGLSNNTWYHVAGMYDGSEVILYLDGVSVDSVSQTGSITHGTQPMCIGSEPDSNSCQDDRFFPGIIDDVRLYDYGRSSAQVIEDMNAGHPVPGSPVGSALLHYRFDEGYGDTAYDMGIGKNNGNLGGATACPQAADSACPDWVNDGKYDKAIEFDFSTTKDYLSIADTDDLSFGDATSDDAFSVGAWVYMDDASGFPIFGKGSDSNREYLMMVSPTDKLQLQLFDDNSSNVISRVSSDTFTTAEGGWHHFAATYDGSSSQTGMVLYYDGSPISSAGNLTGSYTAMHNQTGGAVVGRNFSDGTTYADGKVDDIRVYNSDLTAAQVMQVYNEGKMLTMGVPSTDASGDGDWSAARVYCVPGDTGTCSAPVGEWKFDIKTGSTAYDSSSDSADGSLTSMEEADWRTAVECHAGSCLVFDGSDEFVDVGDTGQTAVKSVDFWVYPASTTEYMIDLNGSAYIWANAGTLTATGFTSPTIYVNGVEDGSVSANTWHHVVVTTDTGVNASDMDIGRLEGMDYFEGKIDHALLFTDARSAAQVTWSYNQGEPIGWWRLDECTGSTAKDESGTGNNGTITIGGTGQQDDIGTCTSGGNKDAWYNGRNGKINASINLDGVDDYIETSSQLVADYPFTMAAWVNTTTTSDDIFTLVNSAASNTYYGLAISASGYGRLSAYNTGTGNDLDGTVTINDGDWHYVVGVFTSATDRDLYIDGVYDNSTSTSATYSSSVNRWSIGRNGGSSPSGYFDGQIDNVRMFNYALTEAQIRATYADGAVSFTE